MKNLVISYFGQTKMVNSAIEAAEFVNTLKYRGSAQYTLICNNFCRSFFEDYFNGKPEPASWFNTGKAELATTNCSVTRVMVYQALAETLEEHYAKVQAEKEIREKIEAERQADRQNQWLEEVNAQAKGWYVVTLDVMVSKIKGNDGVKTYSFKILAESKMDAYQRACSKVNREGVNDSSVSFVYQVIDSAKSAMIEFVGSWTDDAVLEYGAEK